MNIPNLLNEGKAAGFGKVFIDRASGPSEDAIDRNPECRRLTIHGSAAADDQVRIPNQIQTIQYVFGNDDSLFINLAVPVRTNKSSLLLVAWQHNYSNRRLP